MIEMRIRRALARWASVMCAALCVLSPASAGITRGFEQGVGHNAEAVGSGIPGMVFSTISGGDLYFADINSGWYSVTSDNGKSFHSEEYFLSGDVAVYAMELTDAGKITFDAPVQYCILGYSSQYPFYLEAYSASGALLSSASGPTNTRSHSDTGLKYLTVIASDIAYVVFHDEGGYWMIDNVTVPEPSSLATVGLAVCAAFCRRGRRKRS